MSITARAQNQLVVVPDNTGEKQVPSVNSSRFESGRSGNPRGRPRGSRNKLAEVFLHDLLNEWEEHGAKAVGRVREDDPAAFLRVVAVVVRNVSEPPPDDVKNLTDAELDAELWRLCAKILSGMSASEIPTKLLRAGLSADAVAALGRAAVEIQNGETLEDQTIARSLPAP